jgi:hypothetical protein
MSRDDFAWAHSQLDDYVGSCRAADDGWNVDGLERGSTSPPAHLPGQAGRLKGRCELGGVEVIHDLTSATGDD